MASQSTSNARSQPPNPTARLDQSDVPTLIKLHGETLTELGIAIERGNSSKASELVKTGLQNLERVQRALQVKAKRSSDTPPHHIDIDVDIDLLKTQISELRLRANVVSKIEEVSKHLGSPIRVTGDLIQKTRSELGSAKLKRHALTEEQLDHIEKALRGLGLSLGTELDRGTKGRLAAHKAWMTRGAKKS